MTDAATPAPAPTGKPPLLRIRELRTWFHGKRETVRAVDDIDLTIEEGENARAGRRIGFGQIGDLAVGDAPA